MSEGVEVRRVLGDVVAADSFRGHDGVRRWYETIQSSLNALAGGHQRIVEDADDNGAGEEAGHAHRLLADVADVVRDERGHEPESARRELAALVRSPAPFSKPGAGSLVERTAQGGLAPSLWRASR
jgi:hypothetical protein